VWLATPLIVGAAGWRSWQSAGRAQRAACAEVELAIDGALDRLEAC
jgi:hypothetical protein